jgi:hypothetical protein
MVPGTAAFVVLLATAAEARVRGLAAANGTSGSSSLCGLCQSSNLSCAADETCQECGGNGQIICIGKYFLVVTTCARNTDENACKVAP